MRYSNKQITYKLNPQPYYNPQSPTTMGQSNTSPLLTSPLLKISPTQQSQFMKQLCYIQSSSVRDMGHIQIYRFKQAPYDYIMKHHDAALDEYLKNISVVWEIRHKNIAQIHYFKNNTQFHMCGKSSQIQIYSNYYAITLEEIIKKRRKDDIRFTSNEIWYVLKCLLEVSVALRAKHYNFSSYKSKNITLSSQGYLKLYILHLHNQSPNTQDHSQNCYTQAFNDRSNIQSYLPLPPQYLQSIKQGNLIFPFQHEKQDSFMIATVILEMMTDQDVRKYYMISQEQFCQYKRNNVWKDIGMLGYVYDRKYLLGLLERMLGDDPSKRISTQEALKFINDNRDNINIGGSLRMFQDEQNHIKPKVSYRTSFDFESNILKTIQPNMLEHKLTACPIKTLYRKNNNKSMGVSLTSSKKSIQTKDKSLNKSKVDKVCLTRGSSLSSKAGINKI